MLEQEVINKWHYWSVRVLAALGTAGLAYGRTAWPTEIGVDARRLLEMCLVGAEDSSARRGGGYHPTVQPMQV